MGWGIEGEREEVNRRRGRCWSLGCLCANNYTDEIRRERTKHRGLGKGGG